MDNNNNIQQLRCILHAWTGREGVVHMKEVRSEDGQWSKYVEVKREKDDEDRNLNNKQIAQLVKDVVGVQKARM
jgi:hypothetical protein